MDDIRTAYRCEADAGEGVDQSLKGYVTRRPQGSDLHAVPIGLGAFGHISTATDDLDAPAEFDEFESEHFDVLLDTALDIRDAAQSEHHHAARISPSGVRHTVSARSRAAVIRQIGPLLRIVHR